MKFFFSESKKQPTSRFANFFLNAPSREKKRVMKQAIKQANQDQRNLLEKYDRKFSDSL